MNAAFGCSIGFDTGKLRRLGVLAFVCLCLTASAWAQFPGYPGAWIDQVCPGTDPRGPYVKCWVALPRFATAVQDPIAALDQSHKSNPQPRGADIYAGEQANQNSIYYAYDPDTDVVMFRKRLDGTPTLGVNGGSSPPGTDASGPFKSNTAWNFVMDFNGDGWADIVGATDGNTGKQQDPTDTIQLGYANTPGSQAITVLGNGGSFDPAVDLCTVGGRFLFVRKANWAGGSEPPPVPGCPTQLSPLCNFIFTRVTNVCPPTNPAGCTTDDANFFLDMQFPRQAFDSCTGPNSDSDSIGGRQLLYQETPFTLCVTTSTQPNDFTNKDLALNDSYIMGSDKPLPCSNRCTLINGCTQQPYLYAMDVSCGAGVNNTPITLTAQVLDTSAVVNGVVTDSIQNVQFFYIQEDGAGGTVGSYALATPAAGSSNPVTVPGSQINIWSMQWNTSSLPTSPSSKYRIRVTITDDQNNTISYNTKVVDLLAPGCAPANTPVTLAHFKSTRGAGGVVDLEWATATEAGNLGFNVYGGTDQGWTKLNVEPIASTGVDSAEPQTYRFQARPGSDIHVYAVEDLDLGGGSDFRGPFQEGRQYGAPVDVSPVDWEAVRAESRSRTALAAPRFRMASRGGTANVSAKTGKKTGYPEVTLTVDQTGLHRVTFEDLAAQGFDYSGAHASDLALVGRGQPVPIRVVGGEKFGPGSWIEFYGESAQNLYTDTTPYRLSVNRDLARSVPVDRKRPKPRGSSPQSYLEAARVERDRAYHFASPLADPWYDSRLLAWGSTPASLSFDLEVDDLAASGGSAKVWAEVYGMSQLPHSPDHHLVLELNGAPLAEEYFDDRDIRVVAGDVPAGLLREGVNQLTLRLPADLGTPFDTVFVNSFGVTYPRRLKARGGALRFAAAGEAIQVRDLTGPDAVVYRLGSRGPEWIEKAEVAAEGGSWTLTFNGGIETSTYLVSSPSAMRTPGIRAARPWVDITGGRADYLIISHPNFLNDLSPLVSAREADGLSVRVVDVEDVYEQFSHGVVDAAAIRSYVARASREMGTRYVLLVGGDTYDYKNRLGLGAVSLIPSLYAATGSANESSSGSVVRFAPVDPLFGDVDGDQIPDLAVGRFPVRTSAELATLIEKTLQYGRKSYRRTGVFASDGSEEQLRFSEHSDDFSRGLTGQWSVRKAYIDLNGLGQARQKLIDSVNQGMALTTFIGHSSPTLWSFSRLFTAADALQLTNVGRPTVVVQWGCFNNYHVLPTYDTLGHNFLLQPQGAAAVLGSSTQSESSSARALSRELAPLLGQPGLTLGEAVRTAKRRLATTQPQLLDVILGWTILGDPAIVIEP